MKIHFRQYNQECELFCDDLLPTAKHVGRNFQERGLRTRSDV